MNTLSTNTSNKKTQNQYNKKYWNDIWYHSSTKSKLHH